MCGPLRFLEKCIIFNSCMCCAVLCLLVTLLVTLRHNHRSNNLVLSPRLFNDRSMPGSHPCGTTFNACMHARLLALNAFHSTHACVGLSIAFPGLEPSREWLEQALITPSFSDNISPPLPPSLRVTYSHARPSSWSATPQQCHVEWYVGDPAVKTVTVSVVR
jgi:hypothetical protein